MELFSYNVNGWAENNSFFYHLLCIIRDGATYKVFVSTLILIVEDLTCICTINDTLIQLRIHKNTCGHPIPVSTNTVLSFPIPVKSKYWMEKMSTTNYCQPWSQSQRKSARPPPPLPSFLAGLSSVRAEPQHPCQLVRQMHQTCGQTLQRTSSVLDVSAACGASIAAARNKQPQVLSCDSKGDFSVIIYSSWGVVSQRLDFSQRW